MTVPLRRPAALLTWETPQWKPDLSAARLSPAILETALDVWWRHTSSEADVEEWLAGHRDAVSARSKDPAQQVLYVEGLVQQLLDELDEAGGWFFDRAPILVAIAAVLLAAHGHDLEMLRAVRDLADDSTAPRSVVLACARAGLSAAEVQQMATSGQWPEAAELDMLVALRSTRPSGPLGLLAAA